MALDPKLVNLWRNGDPDARNEACRDFLDCFYQRVYKGFKRQGYSHEDAEEMAKDAIWETFRWLDEIPMRNNPGFVPNEGHFWNLLEKKIQSQIRKKASEKERQSRTVSLNEPVGLRDEKGRTWEEVIGDPSPTPQGQLLDSSEEEELTRKREHFKERLTERRRKLLETHLEASEIREKWSSPEEPPSHFELVKKIYQEKYKDGKELSRGYYDKLNEKLRKDWKKFEQDLENEVL